MVDNDALSYKAHGYELEKLEPSAFQRDKVIGCINFTDETWENGVRRQGAVHLLISNAPAVREALAGENILVLGHQTKGNTAAIDLSTYQTLNVFTV